MKRAVGTTLMVAGGAAAAVIAGVVTVNRIRGGGTADEGGAARAEGETGQRHCPNCGRFMSRYGECRHCAAETGIASGCLRQAA